MVMDIRVKNSVVLEIFSRYMIIFICCALTRLYIVYNVWYVFNKGELAWSTYIHTISLRKLHTQQFVVKGLLGRNVLQSVKCDCFCYDLLQINLPIIGTYLFCFLIV